MFVISRNKQQQQQQQQQLPRVSAPSLSPIYKKISASYLQPYASFVFHDSISWVWQVVRIYCTLFSPFFSSFLLLSSSTSFPFKNFLLASPPALYFLRHFFGNHCTHAVGIALGIVAYDLYVDETTTFFTNETEKKKNGEK